MRAENYVSLSNEGMCFYFLLYENFRVCFIIAYKVKVKLSLYRPWRPLGLQEVEDPTFSDIQLIDGGKVVSPMRRPLFTPLENSWWSFLLEAESTPGS
jgi:hypothetical protein